MQNISINSISISNGRRELGEIAELKLSIESIGLINPITVTPENVLIAGLHRLEACKSLGWSEIPAVTLSLSDIDAQLAEIDENLVRNELSALERSEQLKKRKDLYEAKYPQTKAGVAGGKASGISRNGTDAESALVETKSFVKDAAAKTNKSTRTISQDVQIANRIAEPVRDMLRHTPIANKKGELLALAQVDEQTQKHIAEKIVSGEAATVNQALNKLYPSPPKVEPKSDLKSHQWISRVVSYNDGFKIINERDGGIRVLTKNWTLGNKLTFLEALESIVRNYGELAAELGEMVENEK